MSAITLSNEIIHYEVLGRGRPLVFLHGWVGSWRYWIPAMQAASVSFRAYALDLWGFGDTAKNPRYYSLQQQINLLEQFLGALGTGKISLVGHGLGAIIALLYAVRRPELVDRLMAIGLPRMKNDLHPRLQKQTPEELAGWLLGRGLQAEAACLEAPKADPRAVQHSLAGLQHIDLACLPYHLSLPCLMVDGQNDPSVQSPPGRWSHRLPGHIHQVVFQGSGHFPMLDSPRKFNRLLAGFLGQQAGASPRQLQLKEEWKRRVR